LFVFNNIIARPPAAENPEADNTSQAVKRRLPREVKLKLAKVARLAVLATVAF
jgi:ubinuclein